MRNNIHIAHLINPVFKPVYPELMYAQPITFESMHRAAESAVNGLTIELMSAQFAEDCSVIPTYFKKTTNLERSVLDVGKFKDLKKFPLLKDLLKKLYEESDAEYLIYTNADIALQPHFYNEVAKKIKSGLDAFIINRRRIPGTFRSIEQLPQMYREKGLTHPGFDCFVFHRSLYKKFELGNICIGIPFVEMAFSQNLFCHAKNFCLFDKEFLTFHIGLEIFKKRDREYYNFNRNEFRKIIHKLWPLLDNSKFPWGNKKFYYRMFKWGLHPAIPIRLAMQLEMRRWNKHTN